MESEGVRQSFKQCQAPTLARMSSNTRQHRREVWRRTKEKTQLLSLGPSIPASVRRLCRYLLREAMIDFTNKFSFVVRQVRHARWRRVA